MKITDPVCKMTIEEENAVATSFYKGKTYHFCSDHCKESFDNNPELYLGAAGDGGKKEQAEVSAKAEWICPMHPEIIRYAPGNCPKCGMSLEPKTGMGSIDPYPTLGGLYEAPNSDFDGFVFIGGAVLQYEL